MSDHEMLLMIPGPTNVPDRVLEMIAQPPLYHRGESFREILRQATRGLQAVYGTDEPVVILTASGTGAIEAAVSNCISPGEEVLAFHTGKFGRRMGDIAARYGAQVHWHRHSPGQAPDPAEIRSWLQEHPVDAAVFPYNETSTGLQQDLEALAEVFSETRVLTIVDAVSILGGAPVDMDRLGLDVVCAGSQKAMMLPPGLSFAALSSRAQEKARAAENRGYYFDLPRAIDKFNEDGQTPFTPAVGLAAGLREALQMMQEEGLREVYERHRNLGRACRAAMQVMGLELLVEEPELRSSVVTAVKMPDELDSSELVARIRDNEGILISGGQGELKGRIFRVGHMGMCTLADLRRTVSAIAVHLSEMGHDTISAEASAAAQKAFVQGDES